MSADATRLHNATCEPLGPPRTAGIASAPIRLPPCRRNHSFRAQRCSAAKRQCSGCGRVLLASDTTPMKLPPAWRVTYGVQLCDPAGFVTAYSFQGSCSTEHLEFAGDSDPDSEFVARVTVVSAHPYRVDAEPECLRAARDVCNIQSIARGEGRMFEPVGPPIAVERLEGAKDMPAGAGGGDSATLHAVVSVSTEDDLHRLEAAERAGEDPSLRADLDTYRLATLETDGPARFIHFHRIFDQEADALLEAEPLLLTEEEIEHCVTALGNALPDRLTSEERARLETTARNQLGKVRERSRPRVLAEGLSNMLGREVSTREVGDLTSTRGKYAHGSTEMETKPGEDEEHLVRDAAVALLKQNAGLAVASGQADQR